MVGTGGAAVLMMSASAAFAASAGLLTITPKTCMYLFGGSIFANDLKVPPGAHTAQCSQTFTTSGMFTITDLGAYPGTVMTIDAFGGNGGSMNGNPGGRGAQLEKRVTAPAQGAFRIAIGGGGSTAGVFGTGGAGGAGGGANGAAAGPARAVPASTVMPAGPAVAAPPASTFPPPT
jgi:hypothetical protein